MLSVDTGPTGSPKSRGFVRAGPGNKQSLKPPKNARVIPSKHTGRRSSLDKALALVPYVGKQESKEIPQADDYNPVIAPAPVGGQHHVSVYVINCSPSAGAHAIASRIIGGRVSDEECAGVFAWSDRFIPAKVRVVTTLDTIKEDLSKIHGVIIVGDASDIQKSLENGIKMLRSIWNKSLFSVFVLNKCDAVTRVRARDAVEIMQPILKRDDEVIENADAAKFDRVFGISALTGRCVNAAFGTIVENVLAKDLQFVTGDSSETNENDYKRAQSTNFRGNSCIIC